MSEEIGQLLTGKAKKQKRSEDRYNKAHKRKREEDQKEENGDQNNSAKKDRGNPHADESVEVELPLVVDDIHGGDIAAARENQGSDAKPKKRRKKTTSKDDNGKGKEGKDDQPSQPVNHRYIVFIGNLPYGTTLPALETHFAAIKPSSIRHRTDPRTKRSKGFAFLEFEAYDRMKTCLKQYHHTDFTSGVAGEKPRRINVELTAGGGGKGEARKEKVKVKNEKLQEERQRRAEALAKEEAAKEKKGKGAKGKAEDEGKVGKDGKGRRGKSDARPRREELAAPDDAGQEGMHPSRMARLQKGR